MNRRSRNFATGAATAALLSAIIFLSRSSGFQPAAVTPRATFLITLGEHATSGDRWDGSAQVNAGKIAGIQGWHFLQTDQITSSDSWRASVRVDEVAPFADPHYAEIRGGEKLAPLYFPTGVYVTVEGSAGARLTIQTAQGKFDFALDRISLEPTPFLDGRALVSRVPAPEKIT